MDKQYPIFETNEQKQQTNPKQNKQTKEIAHAVSQSSN